MGDRTGDTTVFGLYVRDLTRFDAEFFAHDER
jgi:hypothetical protein